ncbi:MAG: hypothetical protein CEE40_02580 [Chloroflexi bacterium B3_Chlor]|nr:MAG: hypothetical protein CEE40_02580 [Chloroflexi bacterium B3_Chlor]
MKGIYLIGGACFSLLACEVLGLTMAADSRVEQLLKHGIAAAKVGKSDEARELLSQTLGLDPENEKAWLWLSSVVPDEDKIECLERVLAINPQNEAARLGLEFLLSGSVTAPEEPAPDVESEAALEKLAPEAESGVSGVAEDVSRGAGRSSIVYLRVTLLALVAFSVCGAAILYGRMMLATEAPEPGPATAATYTPGHTTTLVPVVTSLPAVMATPSRTPVPTYTLVVPDARIPGFPIINEGAYDEIEARVRDLRGLVPLRDTQRLTFTRYRLEEYLSDVYQQGDYLQQLEVSQRMYAVLGLIDEGYDLAESQIEMQREGLAGLYDWESEEIYLVLDRYTSDLWLEVTFAHEFTHALQDQHFDLDSLYGRVSTTDSILALQALIEGDATLVMMEYAFQYLFQMQFEHSDLLEVIQDVEQGEYEDAPGVVLETAWFPYGQGIIFAAVLVEHGGWDRLDQAFRDSPQTTEQVMHPSKYLAGEGAQVPEVGDLLGVLGPGWSELRRDVLGEFLIRVYLERELGSEEALLAAEGWGGDSLLFLANDEEERYVLVLRTSWDSTDDADEFLSLYVTFMERSGPAFRVMDDPHRKEWRRQDQVTYLSQEGREVLLVLASDDEALDLVLSDFPTF